MSEEGDKPEAIYLPEDRQPQLGGIEDIVRAEKRAERKFKFQEGLRAILGPYQIALQIKARDFDSAKPPKHSWLEKTKLLLHTSGLQIHTSQWRYMSPEKPTEQFQATLHYFRDDRGIARAVGFICERKTDSTMLWMNKNGVIRHILLLGPGIAKILVDWRNKIGLDVKDIRQENNAIQINLPAKESLTIKTGRVAPGFTGKLKQPGLIKKEITDLSDLRTTIVVGNDWQFYNVRTKRIIEGDNVLDLIAEILRHIPARTIPKR